MLSALFLALALPAAAQDTDIKSASIALERKTSPIEIVTLENKRDSPLVAWHIALQGGEGKGGLTHTSDFSWQNRPAGMTGGPIKPQERRQVEIELRDPDVGSPTLTLALFEDGYIEGTPEAIDLWQKQRRDRADDAHYWIRVFANLPAGSESESRRYLEIHAAERAAEGGSDPSGLRIRLSNALRVSRQPGSLLNEVEKLSQEASRQYDALTRRPARAPALEVSTPVALSSRREAIAEYVVVIRNLRNVPIEAVGFELLDPVSLKPRSGQGADFGVSEIGTRTGNTGRIGGGDSREFPLASKTPDGSPPVPRLTFVMFDDLTYEGSSASRGSILASRESNADDITYALGARAEAMAKSLSEVAPFLTAKKLERANALQAQGRHINLRYIDELIHQASLGRERIADDSPYVQHLVRYRAQLLRHLKQ